MSLRFHHPLPQILCLFLSYPIHGLLHFLLLLLGFGDLLMYVIILHNPNDILIHFLLVLLCFLLTAKSLNIFDNFLDFFLEVQTDGLMLSIKVVDTISVEGQQFLHGLFIPISVVVVLGLQDLGEELRVHFRVESHCAKIGSLMLLFRVDGLFLLF